MNSSTSATNSTSSTSSTGRNVVVLTIGTTLANAVNYGINVALGRALKPKEFAEASLLVAVTLVLAAAAIGMQLVTATVMSRVQAAWQPRVQLLARWCILCGAAAGLLLAVLALPLAAFFRMESPLPFVLLGLGLPGYALLSVARGVLQGQMDFRKLAATFVLEALCRAGVTAVGLLAGLGAASITLAMSVSFVMAWLPFRSCTPLTKFARPSAQQLHTYRRAVHAIVRPVAVLLLAQVIIANEDIMFAMRSLDQRDAGRYSALALVGRGIFFLSWAVVTAVFPAVAQGGSTSAEQAGNTVSLFRKAVLAVLAIGSGASVVAAVFGNQILATVFGSSYSGLGGSLALYAVATTMFSLTNLLATYHVALGNGGPARLMLFGAALQSSLLLLRHATTRELLTMQLIAMTSTLAGVVVQHLSPMRVGRQPKAVYS